MCLFGLILYRLCIVYVYVCVMYMFVHGYVMIYHDVDIDIRFPPASNLPSCDPGAVVPRTSNTSDIYTYIYIYLCIYIYIYIYI